MIAPPQRTLLDAVLDLLCVGADVTVIEVVPTGCQFPTYAPSTAYGMGCRCPRCRDLHNRAALTYKRLRQHR